MRNLKKITNEDKSQIMSRIFIDSLTDKQFETVGKSIYIFNKLLKAQFK